MATSDVWEIKSMINKYKRLGNCGFIKGTKVILEIWSQLNSKQHAANYIPKVVFATLQTTYMLVENPSSSTNNSKDITKLVDSIAMLKHLPNQLSQVCREQRKPVMKPDFSKLWSAKVPLRSQYLFVGCLAKNLWDAKEASTIRKSVGHSSRQSQHSLSHSAHYVKGPTSDFCMREIQQTLQKKKNAKCRDEILEQLLEIKKSIYATESFTYCIGDPSFIPK